MEPYNRSMDELIREQRKLLYDYFMGLKKISFMEDENDIRVKSSMERTIKEVERSVGTRSKYA